MTDDPIQVLVVDDHELARKGVLMTLSTSSRPIAMTEASSTREALREVDRKRFDVVVIDLSMPGRSGHDLLSELVGRLDLTAIVLTGELGSDALQSADDLGARAIVSKADRTQSLLEALEAVLDGRSYKSTSVLKVLRRVPRRSVSLSPRQQAIVQYVADGISNKEISHRLGISGPTVSFHLSEVRKKLGVDHNRRVVEAARRSGHIA